MRTHGTLTKWNEDRGFGFITPAKGTADLFVHISAFPRDGGRPRLNELISFEVEPGADGRPRAVRVMRTGQGAARRTTTAQERQRHTGRGFGGVLGFIVVAGIGVYGYLQYKTRAAPMDSYAAEERMPAASQPSPYSCDGRTRCPQMSSCAEATYFIRNCPGTEMDGDGDGIPCEDQWCN